jgi:hypothetical protein
MLRKHLAFNCNVDDHIKKKYQDQLIGHSKPGSKTGLLTKQRLAVSARSFRGNIIEEDMEDEDDEHTLDSDMELPELMQPSSSDTSHERPLSQSSQASTSSMSKFMNMTVSRKDFMEKLSSFIFMNNIAFRVVDSQECHDLFSLMGFEKLLPTEKALSGKHLDMLYEKANAKNMKKIKEAKSITLVFDGYTSVTNVGVTTLIACVPEPVFLTLETHDGESKDTSFYVRYLEEKINEIGHEKVCAIMSDNAPVLRSAKEEYVKKNKYVINLGCAAHWFNLFGKDVFKLPTIRTLIASVQNIVNVFKGSTQKTEKFNKEWEINIEAQAREGITVSLTAKSVCSARKLAAFRPYFNLF